MKIINHIWKYITNPDYRLKVYLKRLNKKHKKKYGGYNIPPGLLENFYTEDVLDGNHGFPEEYIKKNEDDEIH